MPTLKQLRYFDAVVRLGHFGRAAEACAVTQPALSMQIQGLEAELGLTLLERLPNGARLTTQGTEIARRAAHILDEMQNLTQVARHSRGLLVGPLNLGVIPSIAPYLLPPLLPKLKEQYPDLQLRIRESQTENLVQELQSGELDLLLLALPIEEKGIETLHLFDDPFVLVVPKGFDDQKHLRAPPDLISGERLLLLEEGHCFRDQALAFCQLRKVGPVDTFGVSTLATVVQLVANGMGLTFLPQMAISVESNTQNVHLMRMESPEPFREIGLAWRHTSTGRAGFEAVGRAISTLAGVRQEVVVE